MDDDGIKEENKPKFDLIQQFIIQMTAGAGAGITETCLMHPSDTIKTRIQLQAPQIAKTYHPKLYSGIFDCIYKMVKYEGVLSIWKGVIPALVVEIPRNALKFFMFEQYIYLFTYHGEKTTSTYYLAGLASGLSETLMITPFEVVKTHMQAKESLAATSSPTNLQTVKKIIKEYGLGLRGIYRGLTATIMREGLYSTVTFGFYLSMKKRLSFIEDPFNKLLRDISLGLISGLLAAIITTPFDAAKSRIQGPQKYPPIFSTYEILRQVYRTDGLRGLYSGVVPRAIRLSFGTSVLFVTYDRINLFMQNLMSNSQIST